MWCSDISRLQMCLVIILLIGLSTLKESHQAFCVYLHEAGFVANNAFSKN